MASKLYLASICLLMLITWHQVHRWLFKRLRHLTSAPRLFVIDKLTFYGGLALSAVIGLRLGGAELSDLLATAGVLTVALGFAAKTSVSQLISGVILLGGKIIQKDDVIKVGAYLGVVDNIDVFSTRLRTFDNILISIPNEKLLTEYVSNYSQYPIRRISCEVMVSLEDLSVEVIDTLLSRLRDLDELLVEPEPLVAVESVPGRGFKISARAWCDSNLVIKARTRLTLETARHLSELGIQAIETPRHESS